MISTGKPLFLNTTTGSIEQYTSDVNMDLSGVTLTTLNVSGISTIGGATVSSGAISASSFSGSSLNVSGVSTVGGSTLNSGAISGSSLNVSGVSTVGGATVNSGVISGISSVTTSSGEYLTVPPGTIIAVASDDAPPGYLKANGATISRATYNILFDVIGTTFGSGDGTTFGIPDLRGEFIRGWDDGRGADSGRAFGTAQTDAFRSHTHAQTNGFSGAASAGPNTSYDIGSVARTTGSSGGTETRPRNVALLYCIKY